MHHIRHEIKRLKEAMDKEGVRSDDRFAMYIAHLALSWAINPNMHTSPYDVIINAPVAIASDPLIEEPITKEPVIDEVAMDASTKKTPKKRGK